MVKFIHLSTDKNRKVGYSFKYRSLVAHHRIIYISRITHLRIRNENARILEAAFVIFQPRLRAREIITRDEAPYTFDPEIILKIYIWKVTTPS